MTRNPRILVDKLRRAGLSSAEVSRRTDISESLLRKLRRGVIIHHDLRPDQVARLASLADEVARPVG